MTKSEAFLLGRFERVEFTSVAETSSGKRWAQGVITYRRYRYEMPISEHFQFELTEAAALRKALHRIVEWIDAGCDPSRNSLDAARALVSL